MKHPAELKLDVIEKLNIEDGLLDLEYDAHFQQMLDADQITPKWVEENAIWMQLEGESDEAYEAFKKFVALPIDKWDVKFLPQTSNAQHYSFTFHWTKRRLLYLKYKEWLDKRRSELEHLEAISLYRDNQAKVLKSTTHSALTLIEKLRDRIDSIEPDDIDPRSIPQFISALSTFLELSADAEARALAVDSLLKLHAEDLSSLNLREHISLLQAQKEGYKVE